MSHRDMRFLAFLVFNVVAAWFAFYISTEVPEDICVSSWEDSSYCIWLRWTLSKLVQDHRRFEFPLSFQVGCQCTTRAQLIDCSSSSSFKPRLFISNSAQSSLLCNTLSRTPRFRVNLQICIPFHGFLFCILFSVLEGFLVNFLWFWTCYCNAPNLDCWWTKSEKCFGGASLIVLTQTATLTRWC